MLEELAKAANIKVSDIEFSLTVSNCSLKGKKNKDQMIKSLIKRVLLKKYYNRNKKIFEAYFQKILKQNPDITTYDKLGLEEWLKKWEVFGQKPSIYGYKLYNHYIKNDSNIVPNEIARNYIEPILTPQEYQPFYNDKNSFGILFDKEWMPKTYLRSINQMLYNGNYESISMSDFPIESLFGNDEELIVKPAKNMGGKGISLFKRNDNGNFVDDKGNVLSFEYLNKTYETNYLVQEKFKQSQFMSQFNPTSVNTLRIAVYRDVSTGKLDILGGFLRIGGKGSFVDNISSGGSSVPINIINGLLGKYACDKSRVKHNVYNDINFAENDFIIPNWDKIKEFVFNVAKRMPHMKLFANDVAIDIDGNPKLIEVNTTDFSYMFYQVSGTPVFGKYTDELISFCLKENKKIKQTSILKYY